MSHECRGHVLTVVEVGARHGHQVLHGQVRGDLSLAHLLLNRLREDLHQRQPARDPAHIPIEAPRQIVEAVAEMLFQLGQQPALLERGLRLRQAHRAIQHQRLGLTHRPDHCFHRVPPELLECGDALEPVNHSIAVRLTGHGHDHDRGLLACFCQRCHKAPLSLRTPDSQVLEPPVELVKLHLHRASG